VVKKWILKHGKRVPEDRLRSLMPFMGGCDAGVYARVWVVYPDGEGRDCSPRRGHVHSR
jgi:hypothetical protein